ncbi:hypothetical protein [Dyella sp. ASV21]|nr:hypothetical protein [Dyella sp. ASV21]
MAALFFSASAIVLRWKQAYGALLDASATSPAPSWPWQSTASVNVDTSP